MLLAFMLAGGAAHAQAAPPPPPPAPRAAPETAPPPPPTRGPGAPPPAPGPHVVLDRGANGFAHVDVKCAERESTEDCAGIAARMLDKLAGR